MYSTFTINKTKFVFQVILTIFIVIIITLLLRMIFRAKKCLPGPFNLPIIGYLHKLDPAGPHLTLTKLVHQYGPVYRVKLGSINTVVIADAKILKKLLAKDETLGRPPLYIFYTVFDGKGTRFRVEFWKFYNCCRDSFIAY